MEAATLIETLTGALAAASVLGYVSHRARLSPLVGYLLAGILVGPNTPGFVANPVVASELAEVGVVLLLFGVGLRFSVNELVAAGRVALVGAIGQGIVSIGVAAALGVALGYSLTTSIVFGLAVSIASTVVVTRLLADNNQLHTLVGRTAVAWLVVQDLVTVLVLVLLPVVLGGGDANGGIAFAIAVSAVKMCLAVFLVLVGGGRILPVLLQRVAATRSRELFVLAVLVVALGVAVGAARVFGVSIALGAFLAGLVVGRSEFSIRAATEALPLRDAFAVLFFVAVGMLFDPRILVRAPVLVAATTAIVLVCNTGAAVAMILVQGLPLRLGVGIACCMCQIGEFSFVLAAESRSLGVFPDDLTQALVATSIITIAISSVACRLSGQAQLWVEKRVKAMSHGDAIAGTVIQAAVDADSRVPERLRPNAVIVGYGTVGRTVARLLQESQVQVTIVELNLDTVRQLQKEGIAVVYGDAAHSDTLEAARLECAQTLVLSASGMTGALEMIARAREINPSIRVMARSTYVREQRALREAGVDAVFSDEGEMALSMAVAVLEKLGASSDQLDRERDRVRREVTGHEV